MAGTQERLDAPDRRPRRSDQSCVRLKLYREAYLSVKLTNLVAIRRRTRERSRHAGRCRSRQRLRKGERSCHRSEWRGADRKHFGALMRSVSIDHFRQRHFGAHGKFGQVEEREAVATIGQASLERRQQPRFRGEPHSPGFVVDEAVRDQFRKLNGPQQATCHPDARWLRARR